MVDMGADTVPDAVLVHARLAHDAVNPATPETLLDTDLIYNELDDLRRCLGPLLRLEAVLWALATAHRDLGVAWETVVVHHAELLGVHRGCERLNVRVLNDEDVIDCRQMLKNKLGRQLLLSGAGPVHSRVVNVNGHGKA